MNDDRLGCRLGNLLLAVLVLLTGQTWAAAGFTTAFDHVTAGSALELAWDSVAAQYYPLCVTVQLVEKSAGGSKVNAYKANVTGMSCDPASVHPGGRESAVALRRRRACQDGWKKERLQNADNPGLANATGNTFTWSHVPFPLHYVPTGMYQLELRPAAWASGHPPLLAKSTFFTIKEKTSATGPSLSPVCLLVVPTYLTLLCWVLARGFDVGTDMRFSRQHW